jgi:hypothetical protein
VQRSHAARGVAPGFLAECHLSPVVTGRFPVIVTPTDPEGRLSFRNLIELAALRALRTEHEFKQSAVRTALDYARRELGVNDLLASRDLYAHPGELFLEHDGQLVSLNRAGQLGIQAVLQGLLRRIQWDNRLAVRFCPPLPSRPEAKSVNARSKGFVRAPRSGAAWRFYCCQS